MQTLKAGNLIIHAAIILLIIATGVSCQGQSDTRESKKCACKCITAEKQKSKKKHISKKRTPKTKQDSVFSNNNKKIKERILKAWKH